MNLTIREDELQGPEVLELLQQHLDLMASITPPESTHALNLVGLRTPEVTAWTAWCQGTLAGCGALKELEPTHGELKSMHTAATFRGQGVGATMLQHILDEAHSRGYRRLSLETGSMTE
ncbi:MAG: GNAT family N-acetyltransferase, partial [Gammaproteobacteria bacterium]